MSLVKVPLDRDSWFILLALVGMGFGLMRIFWEVGDAMGWFE